MIISAVSISNADLHALNRSTQDLARAFLAASGLELHTYAIGVHIDSWAVGVTLVPEDVARQSNTECISKLKQVLLDNAAQFAAERSILADPADLVQFRVGTIDGP